MRSRGGLRRDLGTLEAYAALIGILIGAGIFKVTSQSWELTGPSVILAHLVLAVVVLATSVAYSIFLSTPLGLEPGGEYAHISRTFGGRGVAFVGAWLKCISYIGALAFLSVTFADYLAGLAPGAFDRPEARMATALGSLVLFYAIHVVGVRWFGRLQVGMLALLGVSIVVLVVPGLFAVRPEHYRPFFTHGASGFAAAMPPLFFAYAGFESLAQTAGEVRDSTRRLPRAFLLGIGGTTVIYLLMSVVSFGVLPGPRLQASPAPMAEVAAVYLPAGAAAFVTLGALMAIATSLNATMLVPSRLAVILAADGLVPGWIGAVSPRTGTPVAALTLTLAAAALLVIGGQISLGLNIAIFALVGLYLLHSLALLMLPARNPALFASVTVRIPIAVQRAAAVLSILAMGALLFLQVKSDLATLGRLSLRERFASGSLTAVELSVVWGAVGALLYAVGRGRSDRFEAAGLPEG
ncbi:MAG TPA: APC family permease [Candidatus Polarisedimenticolia bacterium]|nr:APC family permease [Candidatus Polarisedimenticolia bacterium]